MKGKPMPMHKSMPRDMKAMRKKMMAKPKKRKGTK